MERLIDAERRLRCKYGMAFKASVLAQTREPVASVRGVALSHGLHPNMVHRWLRVQRLARRVDFHATVSHHFHLDLTHPDS